MSDGTDLVGPANAAGKMARARAVPGVAERSAHVRSTMDGADRVHAKNLAAIRRAAELTQVALADRMGTPQTAVSRLERQDDMLLSTLHAYLLAAGHDPRIVVTVDGRDVELDLAAFSTDTSAQASTSPDASRREVDAQ